MARMLLGIEPDSAELMALAVGLIWAASRHHDPCGCKRPPDPPILGGSWLPPQSGGWGAVFRAEPAAATAWEGAYECETVLRCYGAYLLDHGEPERGRALLLEAQRIAATLGAAGELDLVARALAGALDPPAAPVTPPAARGRFPRLRIGRRHALHLSAIRPR